jgi:eukaryotic-like serine/threonine-protein kinase
MEFEPDPNRPARVVGRYALYGKLATGGMATVHFGRLLGPVGFSRTVAIKRLHPQFAKDPEFVAMFLDEARLAARIQHPNVVATVDVVARDEELFIVMDYIRGESFSRILRSARKKNLQPPEGFVGAIVAGMLHGLHAAHEATDERGQPLRVVHRDVSPQNLLIGVDGVPRVLDFGVAKAAARIQVTRDGQMKGKLSYMSPEQLSGRPVDRRSDVFASGVVFWEALTGQRLFVGEDATDVLMKILKQQVAPPSSINPLVRPQLDNLVLRALEKDPNARYATAREFAIALEAEIQLLSPREVGEWVEEIAGDSLERRERALAEIEGVSSSVSELSEVSDSEPNAMGSIGNALRSSRWQSGGTIARDESTAIVDEAATTIYHGTGPLPDPPQAPNSFYQVVPGVTSSNFTGVSVGDVTAKAARVVTDPYPLPTRRKRGWAVALGVALLLGSLALFAFRKPRSAVPVTATVTGQNRGIAIASSTANGTRTATPRVGVDLASLPTAPDEDVPPTNRVRERSAPRSAGPNRRAPLNVVPSAAPRDEKPSPCAQPWFVDEEGIRRVKSACL